MLGYFLKGVAIEEEKETIDVEQKEIFDFILKTIFEIENKQERKVTRWAVLQCS